MVRLIMRAWVGLSALLLAIPAQAEWFQASSDHFVIYADDSERDIIRYVENLERYHSAMAFMTKRNLDKPSPSNRVTIYVVGGSRDIRALAGDGGKNIAGFYIARAGGSVAFVQDIRNQKGYPDFSTIVLLHEYAHHFLISSSRLAMPRWMNEGAAEFFAATKFNDDGSLYVGVVAQHRAAGLTFADPIPVRDLFDPQFTEKPTREAGDAYYGKSWLTYHYLTLSKERAGQIGQYQRHLFEGMAPLKAAEAAFGDFEVLERELRAYKKQRLYSFVLSADKLASGSSVQIRRLSAGEAEILPLQIRSQRGVNTQEAEAIITEARRIAERHPEDAGVLTALAEAEYDAGNDVEAIAAADKAIALDPQRVNAYVQKGYAKFRQAREAEDRKAAFAAAMEPFGALNAIENDHPLPLVYYYRSFAERNAKPNETARAAMERAAELAPFDEQLQLNAGIMLIGESKHAVARLFLQPLASSPHGGRNANQAKRLLAMVADVADGTVVDISNLPEEVETPDLSGAGT